eukprot:4632406-Prorocentrum_lima.AAC.1
MTSSLVGSEMCIRDSTWRSASCAWNCKRCEGPPPGAGRGGWRRRTSVSYTHLTLPTICSV